MSLLGACTFVVASTTPKVAATLAVLSRIALLCCCPILSPGFCFLFACQSCKLELQSASFILQLECADTCLISSRHAGVSVLLGVEAQQASLPVTILREQTMSAIGPGQT